MAPLHPLTARSPTVNPPGTSAELLHAKLRDAGIEEAEVNFEIEVQRRRRLLLLQRLSLLFRHSLEIEGPVRERLRLLGLWVVPIGRGMGSTE